MAGPDVFFPRREDIFQSLKAHCTVLGMVGVAPIDAPVPESVQANDHDLAQAIFEGNIALIREADGLIANLMSLRGQEPDSGTVFEVGFAVALGKPVVAYGVPDGSYMDRIRAAIDCKRDDAGVVTEIANGTTESHARSIDQDCAHGCAALEW